MDTFYIECSCDCGIFCLGFIIQLISCVGCEIFLTNAYYIWAVSFYNGLNRHVTDNYRLTIKKWIMLKCRHSLDVFLHVFLSCSIIQSSLVLFPISYPTSWIFQYPGLCTLTISPPIWEAAISIGKQLFFPMLDYRFWVTDFHIGLNKHISYDYGLVVIFYLVRYTFMLFIVCFYVVILTHFPVDMTTNSVMYILKKDS